MLEQENRAGFEVVLRQVAMVALLATCSAQVARAEDCITCRTPRCSKKVGIDAWCGPGADPLKRSIRRASARTVSKPTEHLSAERRSENSTEPSAPLDTLTLKREDDTGTAERGALLPSHVAPPDTAYTTSSEPLKSTAVLVPRGLSVVPASALPDGGSASQSLVRSENRGLSWSSKRWIAIGLATGGVLTIAVTVIGGVLASRTPRCDPPVGTVSLNQCPS